MSAYRVLVVIAPAQDTEALQRGAEALGDKRVKSVMEEDLPEFGADGVVESVETRTSVAMELEGPTTRDVVAQAREIYASIRVSAGLEPTDRTEQVAMAPMNRLLYFDPKSAEFTQIAEHMYDEGNNLYAVVAAQTAFELYMEGVFEYVTHLKGTVEISAAINGLIRSYNLDDKRVRDVWETFTGHSLTADHAVWREYKEHLTRRHGLVHRGDFVTKDEAKASLNAVSALSEQIAKVVLELMPRPSDDEAA